MDYLDNLLTEIDGEFIALSEPVREVMIVAPSITETIETINSTAHADVIAFIVDNQDKLGLNLEAKIEYEFTKIDTAFFKIKLNNKYDTYQIETEKELNKMKNVKEVNKMKEVKEVKEVQEMKEFNVLRNTAEVAKRNIAKNIEIQISTNQGFMDFLAEGYGMFIQSDVTEGVGKMTVAGDTMAQVLMISDEKLFVKLARKALNIVFPKLDLNAGKGEFNCLYVHELMLQDKNLGFVVMSNKIEQAIIRNIHSCDLNDAENLRKIFRIVNDCFRMYQELTIDAAKKLYEVHAAFYQELLRAESTVHLEHYFSGFRNLDGLDNCYKIFRKGANALTDDIQVGEFETFYTKTGKVKKIIFRDELSKIQNTSIKAVEHAVNCTGINAYNQAVLSDETVKKLGLDSSLANFIMDIFELIIKPYNKLVIDKAQKQEVLRNDNISEFQRALLQNKLDETHKENLDNLSNLARFYTRNLSMVDAGRVIFAASNITVSRNKIIYKEDSRNTAYLNVAPELFYAYFTAEHADTKICGYELLGNVKAADIKIGDEIAFVNGNALLMDCAGIHIDSDFTGVLTVEEFNGKLSVVMDTIQLLEENRIPHTTPEFISIRMMESSIIDAQKFAMTKEIVKVGNFDVLSKQQVIEKAEKITLMPIFSYIDAQGRKKTVNRALVATIPSLDGNTKFEIPFAQYICRSAEFEKELAGLTFNDLKIVNVDGRTAWCKVAYGNFEEVELCLAKNDDLFGTTNLVDNYDFNEVSLAQSVNNENDAFADITTNTTVSFEEGFAIPDDENFLGGNYADYDTSEYDFSAIDYSDFN